MSESSSNGLFYLHLVLGCLLLYLFFIELLKSLHRQRYEQLAARAEQVFEGLRRSSEQKRRRMEAAIARKKAKE